MEVTTSSRRFALIVGVNGQPVPSRAELKYAEDDAQSIAQTLHEDFCGFELFRSPLLGKQATSAQIKDSVIKLVKKIQDGDSILFFFSGHAEALQIGTEMDEVYLVTDDFEMDDIEIDRDAHVSLRWLRQVLFEHKKASSILIILDCCYAGKFTDSAPDPYLDTLYLRLRYYFGEPGAQSPSVSGGIRLALTATGARTAKEENGHGLLTGHILAALKDDCKQVVNERGQITFTRLFDYLDSIMPPDQRPHFFGAGGKLTLATYPDYSVQRRHEHEQAEKRSEREQRLRTMFADHRGFLQDRLESFVGREQELIEVRKRIEVLLSTGGYLTITGQAGQGKSSIIAKLVDDIAREQQSLEHIAYHFIPLTPPPDYQVALLRNLMARLIRKYDLSDLYLASENRAALNEAFPIVLKEISEKGGQEIIFVDGLDQLVPDQQTGLRDLSFLPQGPGNPPQRIVFVLGTRPNDTLRPLELLKPYYEYRLPNLSRADFDQILQHRGVTLEHTFADKFYETLEENALYLDLVAKELAGRINTDTRETEAILQQIADNPENLFSLTIDRMRWQERLWTEVIKPLLGLLLVTNEPLSRELLKQLLNLNHQFNVDGEQFNRGLEKLGGLVVIDDQQRYSLFHLKFRDHLRQDQQRPNKKYVFDMEDEQQWHKRFISWCEQNGLVQIWDEATPNIFELGRRQYTRQHYITHLYYAKDWNKLFKVLDEGAYGKAKVQYDPSMRAYALDLDLGREAVTIAEWNLIETIHHLPHLWRYTLLRCTLSSRADSYPKEAFRLMLILKQETKAQGLAELLTSIDYKAQIFAVIASHLITQPKRKREAMQLFSRGERLIHSSSDEKSKAEALIELGIALGQARLWQEAERVSRSIPDEKNRAKALTALVTALAQEGRWQEAERVINYMPDEGSEAKALIIMATALLQAGKPQQATQLLEKGLRITSSISDKESKASALTRLGAMLGQVGRWEEAEWALEKAEQVISSFPSEMGEVNALLELATAFRQTSKWEEAEQVIRSIANESKKAVALAELSIALGRAGKWQEAEQVIRSISDKASYTAGLVGLAIALGQVERWQQAKQMIDSIPDKAGKAEAFAKLGIALGQAGRWQEAIHFCEDVERVIRFTPDKESEANVLLGLATRLRQAERWQAAELAINSISYGENKARALTELSIALGQAGHWQAAEHVTRIILDQASKAKALTGLATALAQARRWQEARRVTDSIAVKADRAEALTELGIALGRAERQQEAELVWQEARQVIGSIAAREISDQASKTKALTGLATALAQAKRWQEAERVIGSIADEANRTRAVTELGIALGRAGRRQEAERVINSISKADKAKALTGLATALAQARRWQEARRVIDSIPVKADRAEALTELGIALGQAGRRQEAEQIISTISDEVDKAKALTELGIALGQAGRRQEAKLVWQEARQVINSIAVKASKAQALTELATALRQAGLWQEARRVINSIAVKASKAQALTELATALRQAGLWQEARRVINSIAVKADRAEALTELGIALRQAERQQEAELVWQEARQVIGSIAAREISDQLGKAKALTELSIALGQAECWQEAELVWQEAELVWQEAEQATSSISDKESKAKRLDNLTQIFIRRGAKISTVRLVQREWLRPVTREQALHRLPLAFGFISDYPDLGIALYDAFTWVDKFLRG